MNLNVLIGDLGTTKADALLTCINSGGLWFGAIDSVIKAQGKFHSRIPNPGRSGTTNVVPRAAGEPAPWEKVIFITDDLDLPLADILESGLKEAVQSSCKDVVIPAMRMGVMLNAGPTHEQGLEAKCQAIVEGVSRVEGLDNVTLVVYSGDPNKDRIFPLCNDATGQLDLGGRELRCIQI